jgi:hypothetical protein
MQHILKPPFNGHIAEAAAPVTRLLDFILDGRVTLKPRHGDEIHIEHCQLCERGQARLHTDRRFGGIDTGGQIIERNFQNVPAQVVRVVRVVCQGLHVGKEKKLAMSVQKRHAVLQ